MHGGGLHAAACWASQLSAQISLRCVVLCGAACICSWQGADALRLLCTSTGTVPSVFTTAPQIAHCPWTLLVHGPRALLPRLLRASPSHPQLECVLSLPQEGRQLEQEQGVKPSLLAQQQQQAGAPAGPAGDEEARALAEVGIPQGPPNGGQPPHTGHVQ